MLASYVEHIICSVQHENKVHLSAGSGLALWLALYRDELPRCASSVNRSRLRGLRKRAGHFGEKAAAPLLPVDMNVLRRLGVGTVRTLAACHKPCASVVTSSGGDPARKLDLNFATSWRQLPDYASVNISERDAPAVIALLHRMGVGVEAGLATVADAERFVTLPDCHRAFRILIEIEEQDLGKADAIADGIAQVLERANILRPVLLHGFDATVWHFVSRAHQRRWSTRVGLEDGCQLTNGEIAGGNADLVADALQIFRS
ncbi:3-keto-5-aminohexanoate cleavage protein [Sinorhizobium meliloti]|uniref:3-keto-5-aminohexanoate cleavage protein n=1 Tax=Rhizobium meliloti TaxID=382 RepID=UPI0020960ADA|nr:3-keto-5-aminohexanoate cleavage protein [Sinorhizobium meliloti]MCO6425845.1 3-keto-5-aminohexanoate cleavage protein [Sinorhizobium meliloti]